MTTLSTQPAYPVPGRETPVKFTKSNSTADYLRIWVTDAPVGSALKERLDSTQFSRLQVHEGDDLSIWRETFDKGGAYQLVAQEYTRGGATHGGAYEDDPNAAPTETKIGAETSLSLYIGQRMVTTCGYANHTAELVTFVWNDTIRETNLANHGEATPVVKNGTSDRARAAVAATAVKTAVDALKSGGGVAVATAVGTPSTLLQNFVEKIDDHFPSVSPHQNPDDDNALGTQYEEAPTPETMPGTVSKVLSALKRHYTNDGGLGAGTAGLNADGSGTSTPYHDVTGQRFDFTNMPLFDSVSDTAEAYRALGDIWRSYEAHRVSTAVHDNADTTNTLTALPLLLEVHRQFFAQLASISPTVPDTQSTGAVLLMTQTGAVES